MRILITGGAGFIGSNLVRFLMSKPDVEDLLVLDDLSTGSASNLAGLGIELRTGSILDVDAVTAAAGRVTTIIHLAAIPSVPRSVAKPVASHHANATGTLNVLEAARAANVGHIVVASSSSVYGSNPKLPKSEFDWTRPMSPYAVSKLAAEAYALAYQQCFGIRAMAFRFFNIYGPAQSANHAYAAVIPQFIEAALRREPVIINGSGEQTRDFTNVNTVCEVLHSAARDQVHDTDPVNLAYGTRTSLLELIHLLEEIVGYPIEREHRSARVGDVPASQADSTRLLTHFSHIRPVSLARGLAQTVNWYQEQLRMPLSDRPKCI